MLLIYLAFLLDFVTGDPEWFPHPVRAVGFLINFFEKITVRLFGRSRIAGIVTGVSVISISTLFVYATIFIAESAINNQVFKISYLIPDFVSFFPDNSNVFSAAVTLFWLWAGFSARSLSNAGLKIHRELKNRDICDVRKTLSMFVGRDTDKLNRTDISRAAIETVAENCVDGILSPIFFAVLGGAPLLWLFKAVSTCDSMVGYKNEKYIKFGTFCAKTDDVLNFIPARLSYIFFPAAAFILKMSPLKALKTAIQDSGFHSSPNSGIPEAAIAGALEVSLGGKTVYGGIIEDKKIIGSKFYPPQPDDIKKAVKLVWLVSLLMLFSVIPFIFYPLPKIAASIRTFLSLH